MRRLNQDDYEECGGKVGLIFAGDMPENVNQPALWICKRCGGRVSIRLSNIRYGGYGCPICSGNRPKTIEDYRALGEKVGLNLAGNIPKNTVFHALWNTRDGQTVKRSYNQINARIDFFKRKYGEEHDRGIENVESVHDVQ